MTTKEMKQYMTRFCYYTFKTPQGEGIGCLAFDRLDDANGQPTYTIGFSFCSPKDKKKFTKFQARTMAEGRLKRSWPLTVKVIPTDKNIKTIDVGYEALQLARKSEQTILPGWVIRSIARNEWSQGLH